MFITINKINEEFSEIKKYNGKSVEALKMSEFFFDNQKILVILRSAPTEANSELKIRSLLKKNSIILKKIKPKFFKIIIKILKNSKLFNSEIILNFSIFFDLIYCNDTVVILDDFSHFLYFEKNFLPKLIGLKFIPNALKVGNQCLFLNSQYYKSIKNELILGANDFHRLKSFFFFQFCFARNFLFFLIFFKFQQHFFLKI